ncbi:MAG: leucine-rich repeat domain-containing protein [Bacteroidaceae bacterium]|nr:leucine-rich repeat domain-containing protein [Bacteroidaceae bacterium]
MVAIAQTTATVDGITYEFITKAKLATVVKSASGSYTGNIVIPETVKYDGVAYSVTTIGVGAFSGCTGLTSITIPNSVTTIGSGAFSCCSGLTSVTIPNGITTIETGTFEYCHGLTSITLPEGLTTIGYWAFYQCI